MVGMCQGYSKEERRTIKDECLPPLGLLRAGVHLFYSTLLVQKFSDFPSDLFSFADREHKISGGFCVPDDMGFDFFLLEEIPGFPYR